MAHSIAPWWMGYLFVNPLRKLSENPKKMLSDYLRSGMTVLEPGPGMGFFTLPMARMVGEKGRVVALDVQEKMLAGLRRRARRAGLERRIEPRLAPETGLGVDDLDGTVDFIPAIHVVHEMTDQEAFFAEAFQALRPGGKLLIIEPKQHVGRGEVEKCFELAENAGFQRLDLDEEINRGLFAKPSAGGGF